MGDHESGTKPPSPALHVPGVREVNPAGETDPDDDLLALIAEEDEGSQVFRHTALLIFGEAGPHLQKGFAVLRSIALEEGRCHSDLTSEELFQAEAAALAKDLRLAQTRAAYIALQGPLNSASASQLRTCALMADVARELRTLRQSLEAANA